MNMRPNTMVVTLLITVSAYTASYAQPSHLDKFTTFGIIARDSSANTWGVAIATNNIGIGQPGVFEIKPDVGIVVSIAFTQPTYPRRGIALLDNGYNAKQVIDSLLNRDDLAGYRQIAIMNKSGETVCYTGNAIHAYTIAGSIGDREAMVFGNSFMNDGVLGAMSNAYGSSKGKLYERLYAALASGQKTGGQNSGKMSAAICVKKSGAIGFNETDLRVDYSPDPFEDIRKLVNKQQGLDVLQQARKQKSDDSAVFLLSKAAALFEGWTLTYTEVAK
jgi:uncharacterized Ntn-hydrolase superfamily protein